jgi:hypothetical protein
LSARASEHVLAASDFAAHVRDVLGVVSDVLERSGVPSGRVTCR